MDEGNRRHAGAAARAAGRIVRSPAGPRRALARRTGLASRRGRRLHLARHRAPRLHVPGQAAAPRSAPPDRGARAGLPHRPRRCRRHGWRRCRRRTWTTRFAYADGQPWTIRNLLWQQAAAAPRPPSRAADAAVPARGRRAAGAVRPAARGDAGPGGVGVVRRAASISGGWRRPLRLQRLREDDLARAVDEADREALVVAVDHGKPVGAAGEDRSLGTAGRS